MARATNENAAATRRRVVDVASRLFRRHGFRGVGVDGLMSAAGLSHGGFYRNFASKGDLAVVASQRAFETFRDEMGRAAAGTGDPLGALVGAYLSARHLADMDGGCPLASLAADAARSEAGVRAEFHAGTLGLLALVADALPQVPEARRREEAVGILTTMVGALVLAHAVGDGPLGGAILADARRRAHQCLPRVREPVPPSL